MMRARPRGNQTRGAALLAEVLRLLGIGARHLDARDLRPATRGAILVERPRRTAETTMPLIHELPADLVAQLQEEANREGVTLVEHVTRVLRSRARPQGDGGPEVIKVPAAAGGVKRKVRGG